MGLPPTVRNMLLIWMLVSSSCDPALSRDIFYGYSYYEPIAPLMRTKAGRRPLQFPRFGLPVEFTLLITAFEENFEIHLAVSESLFASRFTTRRYHENSSVEVSTPALTRCYYSGYAMGSADSLAAFNLCGRIAGFFTSNGETYQIEGVGRGAKTRYYMVRHSDARGHGKIMRAAASGNERRKRSARSSEESTAVQKPAGSDSKTRFIGLYLVMDRTLYRKYRDGTESRGIEIVNYASALLRRLNVYLVLVGLEIWSVSDRISITRDPGSTLTNFLYHRQYYINPSVPNDNAQLLVGGQEFDDGVLGKAEIGGMCTRSKSGGITLDNRQSSLFAATAMVHEMGHNLGLLHDEAYSSAADDAPFPDNDTPTKCSCEDTAGKCIMSAVMASGTLPSAWSGCSKSHIEELFKVGGADACMTNLPKLIRGNFRQCGNYLIEEGEECDCGPQESCDNRCCDPTTCRLRTGAVCGSGECCDLTSCSFVAAGELCRPSADESEGQCDLAEYCTGSSRHCPDDVYLHDGAPCRCAGSESYCYRGRCKTRTSQCRLLWGDSGRDSDPACYTTFNKAGSSYGHCGYDALFNMYSRCEDANALCGLLQCQERTEKLAYWQAALLSDAVKTTATANGGTAYCHTVEMDSSPGLSDPSMVPDGAACGTGRVCVAAKCVPFVGINEYVECTQNCSGHGRCNNMKHCHCDVPFAPPYCSTAGPGGSLDSGPASVSSSGQSTVIPLAVVLGCCLPILAIASAFCYYYRGWLTQSYHGLRQHSHCCLWFRYRNVRAGQSTASDDPAVKALTKQPKTAAEGAAASSNRRSVEISLPKLESTTNKELQWSSRRDSPADESPAPARCIALPGTKSRKATGSKAAGRMLDDECTTASNGEAAHQTDTADEECSAETTLLKGTAGGMIKNSSPTANAVRGAEPRNRGASNAGAAPVSNAVNVKAVPRSSADATAVLLATAKVPPSPVRRSPQLAAAESLAKAAGVGQAPSMTSSVMLGASAIAAHPPAVTPTASKKPTALPSPSTASLSAGAARKTPIVAKKPVAAASNPDPSTKSPIIRTVSPSSIVVASAVAAPGRSQPVIASPKNNAAAGSGSHPSKATDNLVSNRGGGSLSTKAGEAADVAGRNKNNSCLEVPASGVAHPSSSHEQHVYENVRTAKGVAAVRCKGTKPYGDELLRPCNKYHV